MKLRSGKIINPINPINANANEYDEEEMNRQKAIEIEVGIIKKRQKEEISGNIHRMLTEIEKESDLYKKCLIITRMYEYILTHFDFIKNNFDDSERLIGIMCSRAMKLQMDMDYFMLPDTEEERDIFYGTKSILYKMIDKCRGCKN